MEAQSLSTCNQCGKKFQRKAHLLRHQQQHSGDRPYTCKFCLKTFKRSDVLRDHFSRCDRRGNAAIPSSLERGRKRHACNECSRLKVKCDNEVPCRKCKEFGRVCVKNLAPVSALSPDDDTPSVTSRATPDLTPSDRNSIGFLLNGEGDTDFMREFPESATLCPHSKTTDFHNPATAQNSYESLPESMATGIPSYPQFKGPMLEENDLDVMLSNLEFAKFVRQTGNWQMSEENPILWSGLGPDGLFLNQDVFEQRAMDIREKLRRAANIHHAPIAPSREVLDTIELLSADRIATNIKLYFRHWHKHGPMIHEPTFSPCTAALPLVLAMMSIGGMYSKEAREVANLKLIFDTIEYYVFSAPGIGDEYDLPGRTYIVRGENAPVEWQQYQLEEIQGAYLMIVLQFWTGNPMARIRVRQQRFQRVVSIFHHLGLPTAQHSPLLQINDQQSFASWIRKESYIRTADLALMLDHSFGIFHNVAPRFQWAEIDLPFPSDDRFFNVANYAELRAQSLYLQPRMKIKDAFLLLFSPPEVADRDLKIMRTDNFTPFDMQLLIHYLYTQVWISTFSNPMASLFSANALEFLKPFRIALQNWQTMWDEIKRSAPEDEWNRFGFQRTAERYFEAVTSILETFEKRQGRFPPIPSDCEKGSHLKRLLTFQ